MAGLESRPEPEGEGKKIFEVVKIPSGEGFSYMVYFPTQEEAAQAISDFWQVRVGSETIVRGIKSGMLQPSDPRHTITYGDRTRITPANSTEQEKHPGKPFRVWFNGNEGAITSRGEAALRYLGFIE